MAEINISYFYIVITNFFIVISIIFHDIIISNNTLMMNIFSMLEEKYLYQRRPINLFDELKTNFHSMDKQKIQESIQKIQFIKKFSIYRLMWKVLLSNRFHFECENMCKYAFCAISTIFILSAPNINNNSTFHQSLRSTCCEKIHLSLTSLNENNKEKRNGIF